MGDVARDRTQEQMTPGQQLDAALKEELQKRAAEVEAGARDAGYDTTLPNQREVVAGTPEHERVLKAYPNATSYGPDVNVLVPEEPEEPENGGEEELPENGGEPV